jgi:uncharacterized protein (UPF0261 family)
MDILDLAGWQEIPARFSDRLFHEHNRLIKSVGFNAEERRALAREMAERLARATGPTHFLLPRQGIEEWDRPGEAAHDTEGLSAFVSEVSQALEGRVSHQALDCHINDEAFCAAALAQLDRWVSEGLVPRGKAAS